MGKTRSASSIIWRTVVCVALAPACRQPAAKPASPAAAEVVAKQDEERPSPREKLPNCDDLEPLPAIHQDEPEPPAGDTSDGRITIFVTSTPPGADVTLMNEDAPRGKTPLEVVVPVEEVYRLIVVSHPGHEDATESFDLRDDRDRALNVHLLDSAVLAKRPRCVDDKPHYDFGFIVS